MEWVSCTYEEQGEAILSILNEAILTSTALYDYQPRTMAQMAEWFALKKAQDFPVLGLIAPNGQLAGFATYGTFRAFPAYQYTVEHSIYIHHSFRTQGLASLLMERLIATAERQQYHTLIGVIDAANQASIALHLKHGFVHAGSLQQVGYKFGRWLDVVLYQRLLATPTDPCEQRK
ncbi:GNAT family N-acetyltransferase [Parvibium lacunae]|uniref:N-acetyltransferase n=1 Tax=Parvibium lacunae TaxID=1888893 RepID=A0A368L3M5_9BURK|nr:GNAT family N-acetyltransferase [Parvibium lacunae]RCS58188.1 N-acetyltransferase [Parvibium lacunae]